MTMLLFPGVIYLPVLTFVCISESEKMAYLKSSDTVKKNAQKWTSNLPSIHTIRRDLPRVECLTNLTRLPQKWHVLGRYHTLLEENKLKSTRKQRICQELSELWVKFSFPTLSQQSINARLTKMILLHEENQRRPKEDFSIGLKSIFDITKVDGVWLCREDKELYHTQIESGGKIGYTTHKPAPKSSIHPSKRQRHLPIPHEQRTTVYDMESESGSSCEGVSSETEDSCDEEPVPNQRKKPCATHQATKLVCRNSLSTHKASKVCKSLAEEGVSLPTPTQSGVWRGVIRLAEKKKGEIKSLLKEEKDYCLHFDGKRLAKQEYQVICIKNATRDIRLGVVRCKSGSSKDIYDALEKVLDEYDAWSSIRMIVCDTTAVNTGRSNGVVSRIQRTMNEKGLDAPQYIGCQHHILDRILKHVLDFYVSETTTKPSLNYKFIDEILENYENLQSEYKADTHMEETENPGWRDDFKFLYELCKAFQHYKKHNSFPIIKWKKLPSLHSARWNSRAIYTLIAYFLLTSWRNILEIPVRFIANSWQEAWFTDQKFKETSYKDLHFGITELKCPSALKCLETHWSRTPSVLDIPRSNMIAERAVKAMEELSETCKQDKYLSDRFVVTKSHSNDI